MKKLTAIVLILCVLAPYALADGSGIDEYTDIYNQYAAITGATQLTPGGYSYDSKSYLWIIEDPCSVCFTKGDNGRIVSAGVFGYTEANAGDFLAACAAAAMTISGEKDTSVIYAIILKCFFEYRMNGSSFYIVSKKCMCAFDTLLDTYYNFTVINLTL